MLATQGRSRASDSQFNAIDFTSVIVRFELMRQRALRKLALGDAEANDRCSSTF
jgi:hypothetical protein